MCERSPACAPPARRCPGLPVVGEAAPQALAVAPQQPVEDAVEEAVQVQAVHVGLPPDPLQRRAHVGPHDVQHLRGKVGGKGLELRAEQRWELMAIEAALPVIAAHLKSAAFELCVCVRGGKQRHSRQPPNRQDLHKPNGNFNQDLHTSGDSLSGLSFQTCTGTLPVHGAIKSTGADQWRGGKRTNCSAGVSLGGGGCQESPV